MENVCDALLSSVDVRHMAAGQTGNSQLNAFNLSSSLAPCSLHSRANQHTVAFVAIQSSQSYLAKCTHFVRFYYYVSMPREYVGSENGGRGADDDDDDRQ